MNIRHGKADNNMELKEMYRDLGSDWDAVIGRFAGNEGLLRKFVNKFRDDVTYDNLNQVVYTHDYDQILLHAHTLKGVALNLGFDNLGKAAAKIVTNVREERFDDIPDNFETLKREHEMVLKLLSQVE